MWKIGIVTISDRCAQKKYEDSSGLTLKQLSSQINGDVISYNVILDDFLTIQKTLIALANECHLILTTGGTGLAAKDVTPEATKGIIHKAVPGIVEAMRMSTFREVPYSILSRSIAGIRGTTLIINFPGNPKAVEECFAIIQDVLPHALQLLSGHTEHQTEEMEGSHDI